MFITKIGCKVKILISTLTNKIAECIHTYIFLEWKAINFETKCESNWIERHSIQLSTWKKKNLCGTKF